MIDEIEFELLDEILADGEEPTRENFGRDLVRAVDLVMRHYPDRKQACDWLAEEVREYLNDYDDIQAKRDAQEAPGRAVLRAMSL